MCNKRPGLAPRLAERHKNMIQISQCHNKEMYNDAVNTLQTSHKELLPWVNWIPEQIKYRASEEKQSQVSLCSVSF